MNSGRPPVRIAHAYGNDREEMRQALAAPVDMVEADIWFRGGRVWVRHERRLGPIPLLVDRRMGSHTMGRLALPIWPRPRYYIRPDLHPLDLGELLEMAHGKRRLLLDVKGGRNGAGDDAFAAAVAQQVSEHGTEEEVTVCGQNWTLLDRLREMVPRLEVRYSIERPWQWERFLRMLADEGLRRICMQRRMISEERACFLEEKGVDVYCWTVDDPAEAARLVAAGVDGIISNNLALLASLDCSPAAAGG